MLREVKIKSVLNGWIVEAGCQKIVFTNAKHMLDEIGLYLENPDKTERRYREQAVNAKWVWNDAEEVTAEVDTISRGYAA